MLATIATVIFHDQRFTETFSRHQGDILRFRHLEKTTCMLGAVAPNRTPTSGCRNVSYRRETEAVGVVMGTPEGPSK